MRKSVLISLLIICLLNAPLINAQQQTPSPSTPTRQSPPQPQQGDDEDVVRISTELVQVDAVVVDKNGRQVTDLRPEEFEVYEDGRRQEITNFSYVTTVPNQTMPADATAPKRKMTDREAAAVPAMPLRAGQVRRTIAIVVDDLSMTIASIVYARDSLRKFVREQMQSSDLVAIIRTSAGSGALQQFTSDRRQLYAAIDRIKWSPNGFGKISAFEPVRRDPFDPNEKLIESSEASGVNAEERAGQSARNREAQAEIAAYREEIFTTGTLGAVSYVVSGLRDLPGRKSILLISDGLILFDSESRIVSTRLKDAIARLIDRANRAAVVINTLDMRGLVAYGFSAEDDTQGKSMEELDQIQRDRQSAFLDSQQGLGYLSAETGGLFMRNTNDTSGSIRRVLDDQSGYYLLGYKPDASTFDASGKRRFVKFSVKVTRPGVKIRTRNGFYNVTDERLATKPSTPLEQLRAALTSPFSTGGLEVRLTSIFANYAGNKSFIRSMLHLDATNLTFAPDKDGWKQAMVDIVAFTFAADGKVVDQLQQTYTIRARGELYDRIMRSGLYYKVDLPVKKSGAYQLRVAVRDHGTGRTGSANQFVEVPKFEKNRLALSGVVMRGVLPEAVSTNASASTATQSTATQSNADATTTTAQASADGASNEDATETDEAARNAAQAGSAVRRLRQGMTLEYGYSVYNAQLDRTTTRPQLQAEVRMWRDGKVIFSAPPKVLSTDGQTDVQRLSLGGRLQLNRLPPGDYVLQVVITDLLAKGNRRSATQWTDFEIVR